MLFLLIADDMTGTLDAGVQFARAGAAVEFCADERSLANVLKSDRAEVFLLDAETRHLSAQEAYRTVFRITTAAVECGVDMILKKTDSGLRGNIGSELAAVMDAAGSRILDFLPAYPRLGRTTRKGVQYIDGIPAAFSAPGRDPFEPVTESSVLKLASAGGKTAYAGKEADPGIEGIAVWDAETEEEMSEKTAQILYERRQNRQGPILWAGCAGLAGALAKTLYPGKHPDRVIKGGRLMIVCGSVSPVSLAQAKAAQAAGLWRTSVTAEELSGLGSGEDGMELSAGAENICVEMLAQYRKGSSCMLDTGFKVSDDGAFEKEKIRKEISRRLAACAAFLTKREPTARLMIIGGDTLAKFLTLMRFESVSLLGEASPGVVCIDAAKDGVSRELLTKSGSFGEKNLLTEIMKEEVL